MMVLLQGCMQDKIVAIYQLFGRHTYKPVNLMCSTSTIIHDLK